MLHHVSLRRKNSDALHLAPYLGSSWPPNEQGPWHSMAPSTASTAAAALAHARLPGTGVLHCPRQPAARSGRRAVGCPSLGQSSPPHPRMAGTVTSPRRAVEGTCKASKSLRRTSECLRHSAAQALSLACPVLCHPHVTLYETPPTLIHMHPFRVDRRTHSDAPDGSAHALDVSGARTLTFRVPRRVSSAQAL
jgi:hypothetical protein